MLTYDAFKTGLSYRSVYAMMWSESEDTGTWRYKGRSGVLGYWRELKAEMYDVYTRTNDRQYARDYVLRRRSQRYAATFLRRLRLSRLTRAKLVYTTKSEGSVNMTGITHCVANLEACTVRYGTVETLNLTAHEAMGSERPDGLVVGPVAWVERFALAHGYDIVKFDRA